MSPEHRIWALVALLCTVALVGCIGIMAQCTVSVADIDARHCIQQGGKLVLSETQPNAYTCAPRSK